MDRRVNYIKVENILSDDCKIRQIRILYFIIDITAENRMDR